MCLLPRLLWKPPTEGDRRLAEFEAIYGKDHPKLSERGDYYEAHLRTRDQELVSLAAQKWYEELLKRYPERQVQFKDVPDEDNGFLQFLNFLADRGADDPQLHAELFSPELLAMLSGGSDWDSAKLEEWLTTHDDLFQQILQIAELPDCSVKGINMERYSFIHARPARTMGLLLQARGRLAMESGDHDTAHRLYQASLNLADHFDHTELHSMLGKSVSTLLRVDALKGFQQHVLPQIANDSEQLGLWRETLSFHDEMTTVFPALMNGEWHISTRTLILPMLLTGDVNAGLDGGREPIHIPDKDAFIEAYTAQNQLIMDTAESGQPMPNSIDPVLGNDPALSEGANQAIGMFYIGSRAWSRGLHRSNTLSAMNDALIAIHLDETLPLDPTTGEAFLWDPHTRTLSAPEGTEGIEPIHAP